MSLSNAASAPPYLCYKELIPCNIVECSCFFTIDEHQYLIVGRSTLLSIYEVITNDSTSYLKLLSHLNIFGKAQDINTYTITYKSVSYERIIITFDTGKIIVANYNPYTNELKSIHLYNAEINAIGVGSEVVADDHGFRISPGIGNIPYIAIDQKLLIACTIIYGRQFLFIPLQENNINLRSNNSGQNNISSNMHERFIIDIVEQKNLFGNIIDFAFLSNYAMPTLVILQEQPVPIGHIARTKHTCSLTAITIDVLSKSCAVLWQQTKLPHNCFKIIPFIETKSLLSSIAVISLNSIILAAKDYVIAFATNGFADVDVSPSYPVHQWQYNEGIELNASYWIETSNCLIGTLKDGKVICINLLLPYENVNNVVQYIKINAEFVTIGTKPSSLCISKNNKFIFLGSKIGNSMLFKCSYNIETTNIIASNLLMTQQIQKKAKKNDDLVFLDEPFSDEIHEEEKLLYGTLIDRIKPSNINEISVQYKRYSIDIVDEINSLGPILNSIFCSPDDTFDNVNEIIWDRVKATKLEDDEMLSSKNSASAYIAERESKDFLQISAGLDTDGAIYRAHKGLKLSKIANRNFPGATSFTTININQNEALILISYAKKTRILKCSLKSGDASSDLNIKEVMPSDICLTGSESTIAINLIASNVVAQVHECGVRVMQISEDKSGNYKYVGLQDLLLIDREDIGGLGGSINEVIVSCDVCNQWITLLSSNKTLYLLEYDVKESTLLLLCKCSTNDTVSSLGSLINGSCISSASLYYGYYITSSTNMSEFDHKIDTNEALLDEDTFLYKQGKAEMNDAIKEEIKVDLKPTKRSRNGSKKKEDSSVDMTNSTDDTDATSSSNKIVDKCYIVIADNIGFVYIICISEMKLIFKSSYLTLCKSKVLNATDDSLDDVSSRYFCDIKLIRLNNTKSLKDVSRLCFIGILDNDDLVVYYGNEYSTSKKAPVMQYYIKVDHQTATRKRRNKTKGNNLTDTLDVSRGNIKLINIPSILNGCNGVGITGSRPLLVYNNTGLPNILPLCLPELPFINSGSFIFGTFNVGDINGIATLWYEHDVVIDVLKSSKQTILGFYQQLPNLDIIGGTGSILTVKKIKANVTIHHSIEVLPKSDDRVEQSLLKNKTFIISCSENIKSPFIPDTLTEAEKAKVYSVEKIVMMKKPDAASGEKMETLYKKFYPDMSSFCNPANSKYGPPPSVVCQSFRLVTVQNGKAVDIFQFPLREEIINIETLYLNVEKPVLGNITSNMKKQYSKRVFIAVCTIVNEKHGEDTQSDGGLYLFGIDYARFTLENNNDEINLDNTLNDYNFKEQSSISQSKFLASILPKLRLLWKGKGPATVVKQFGEYIISTVGNVVYVYKLISETLSLEQIAFYFARFYVTSIAVIKNHIILSDFCQGLQFLVFREEDSSLHSVSCSYDKCVSLTTSFIYDNAALGILIGDNEGNINLMQYNPNKIESFNGLKLLSLADFYVGSIITSMISHSTLAIPSILGLPQTLLIDAGNQPTNRGGVLDVRSRKHLPPNILAFGTRLDKLGSYKTINLIGTVNGCVGIFIPIDERIYRRLALLQQLMAVAVETCCNLNPTEFRTMKSSKFKLDSNKGILDGNLLWKFITLEHKLQNELCSTMGITTDIIIENLQELDLLTNFF